MISMSLDDIIRYIIVIFSNFFIVNGEINAAAVLIALIPQLDLRC